MSDSDINQTYERYKQQLQRIAWRLQYRTRTRLRRELPILYDFSSSPSFAEEVDSRLLVEQWIHSLASEKEQDIIRSLFIEEKTERQVAQQFNISQQAVSKWKKKALQSIYQKMNYAN